LRIFGTHGEIYLEERQCGFVNVTYRDGRHSDAITYVPGQGYVHELEDFYTALRLGGNLNSTPEKALGDIEAIFCLMESIRLNQVVKPAKEQNFEGLFTQVYIPRGVRGKAFS